MTNLSEKILRQIGSNHFSTFFLNAPPGAGKTFLLSTLSESIPEMITTGLSSKTAVFGPYEIPSLESTSFLKPLTRDLQEALFLQQDVKFGDRISISEFLLFFKENIYVSKRQYFLVLYDLQDAYKMPVKELANVFSQVRALGEKWKDGESRLLILFSGCWDHQKLIDHLEEYHTSWPYIPGENYLTMQSVDINAITKLVNQFHFPEKRIPYGKFLFDMCGGHPGSALEILEVACQNGLSFSSLLSSVNKAAKEGINATKLVEFWGELPEETKPMMLKLLNHQRLTSSAVLPSSFIKLYDFGILDHRIINDRSYLQFRSWYVEMVICHHLNDLGIVVDEALPQLNEIIPDTTAICLEGYKLINQIENLVRNFASTYLWAHKSPSDNHPLKNKLFRFSPEKGREEDAYERALDWRENNLRRNVKSVKLNPMIVYLSTTSLSDLVYEIGMEINSPSWIDISNAIREMAGIRDAIMHNQIIDDHDLTMLYDIQEKVYKALSQ